MESNNFRRHESVLKSVRGALIDKQVTFEHQSNLQAELSKIALALTHSRLCRDRLLWVSGGNYRPGAANVAFRTEGDSSSQQLLALGFDFRPDQITKLKASVFHFCQRTTFIYFGRLPIEEHIPDGLRS